MRDMPYSLNFMLSLMILMSSCLARRVITDSSTATSRVSMRS